MRQAAGVQTILMALGMVIAVLPFIWAFLTSVKLERQNYAFPPV